MRIPSAGTPVSSLDLLSGLLGRCGSVERLETDLKGILGVPWCSLTGSGTAALYAILMALREHSGRDEVVLPAYTAPSLVLPIRKAGLRPVLADICVESLNARSDQLLARTGSKTLAVMPVHMFGLPMDVEALASQLKGSGTLLVEDACSATGTQIGDRQAGTCGDVGFYSFNRGKNLSTLSGGAIVSSRRDLVPSMEAHVSRFLPPGPLGMARIGLLSAGLALVVRPMGYTVLYPAVSKFKYTELHTDFQTRAYTPFQAGMGRSLLRKWTKIQARRTDNGRFLHKALDGMAGLAVPSVPGGCIPVYNQFPVLLRDESAREAARDAVLKTGLEATVLYPDPIHRLYADIWDGSGPDPCPNATDVARRLLLLPVHPLVPRSALDRAVDALGQTQK